MPSEKMRYSHRRIVSFMRTDIVMTPLQADIDKCFIHPSSEEDLRVISRNLGSWLQRAYTDLCQGNLSEAIEISLFILDEIGYRFEKDEYYCCFDDCCDTDDCCLQAAYILTEIMKAETTSEVTKSEIMEGLKALLRHTSFDDYCYFDIERFIQDGGIYIFKDWWRSGFN